MTFFAQRVFYELSVVKVYVYMTVLDNLDRHKIHDSGHTNKWVLPYVLSTYWSQNRGQPVREGLVLKYGTDVVPNLQTVIWLGLPESFVHNLALSFDHKHLCR